MLRKDILFILFITSLLATAGCYRKLACPAYQSQFLLEDQSFKQRFSLFNTDSTPKEIRQTKKNKHGTFAGMTYVRKTNEMRNIPMVKIYPVISDSLLLAQQQTDTLRGDSVKTGYEASLLTVVNNDQLVYNSLYGSLLLKEKQRKSNLDAELRPETDSTGIARDTVVTKTKFRIFKKKQKTESKPAVETDTTPDTNTPDTIPADSVQEDDGF